MNIKRVLLFNLCVLAAGAYADSAAYAEAQPDDAQVSDAPVNTRGPAHHKHKHKKGDSISSIEVYEPNMPDEGEKIASSDIKASLKGSATFVDMSGKFGDAVHALTKTALEQDPEYHKTVVAVDHFRTKTQRTIRFTKDTINYVYPYRGFSMSMEGSRVIVDKKQKLTNLWISELTKQQYWDEMHPKIMAQIMQIAMGLGMEQSAQSERVIKTGVDGLGKLVGQERADSALAELTEWKSQVNVPEIAFKQDPWDVDMTERIYHTAQKTSADGDPLISYIYKSVKKFDHGKAFNFAAGVIESNLSAATVLSGNPLISLAAEGANTTFVMTTGGPEENKILKELYYGRRLEIRRKRISEETELALSNYEKALLTHNAPQLAMSEVVLAQLIGSEKITAVLERAPVNEFADVAPIEINNQATN